MTRTNVATIDRAECSEAEWALREDIAACFRLLDKHGMSDLTNGSIVARLPDKDWFLTHPHGLFFHEIRASDLIKADMSGAAIGEDAPPTNFAVCKPAAAIFRARSDVNAVIHAHGQGVMAVAALDCGVLPISESAFLFYNDIAYIDADFYFEDSYCEEIAKTLGPHKAMIYRHHAFASVGASVSEAFYFAFSLNVACETQLKILACNEKVRILPPETCERHYNAAFGSDWKADGSIEWPGMRRILDNEDPSYAT